MALRVFAGTAVLVLTGLTAGCGASTPSHSAVLHLGGSSTASATSLPAGAPNPCRLFGLAAAASLAGEAVQRVGADPTYDPPNVICEYVPVATQHLTLAVLVFEATKLATVGATVDYLQIMRNQLTPHAPVSTVGSLSSRGYPAWSSGPARIGGQSVASCGFAYGGYAYFFWGRWSGSLPVPTPSRVTRLCDQIWPSVA